MAPEKRSDAQLLESWLAGDEASFTELMRRHEQRIFSLACRMMGDRFEAFDATQETFTTAFRKAHSWRGEAAFGTWLFRIGINTCNDLLRKRKGELLSDDPASVGRSGRARPGHEAQEQAGAGDLGDSVAVRLDIAQALAALAPEYRIAVTMHDLGGISYEEIARATESPLGTVKSRISRGRRLLAELLEHRRPPPPSKDQT